MRARITLVVGRPYGLARCKFDVTIEKPIGSTDVEINSDELAHAAGRWLVGYLQDTGIPVYGSPEVELETVE